MAISYIGGTSADTTTTSLPVGAQTGDLAIVVTARNNVSGSGIPLGWNDLGVISGGSGGTAHGQRVGWKLLEAADITAADVGQWATAKTTQVLVYRAASGVSDDTSGTGASGNTITFPARSSLSSGSWVVAVGTHRSASDVDDIAATDYTNRSAAFTATSSGGMDTNGAVSAVVERTATVNASSGNVGRTMEVEEAAAPPAITGTGGLSFAVTASAASGSESFESTAAIAFEVTGLAGDSKLIFRTIGGLEFPVTSLAGDGEVEEIVGFTGTGGVAFPVTAIDAAGDMEFSGSNGLAFSVTQVSAEGGFEFSGSGALSFSVTTIDGNGEVEELPVTGEGSVTFTTAISGAGTVPVVEPPPSQGGSGGGGGWGNRYTLVPIHWPAPIDDDDEIPAVSGWCFITCPQPSVHGSGTIKNPLPITGSAAMEIPKAKAEVFGTYVLRIAGSASMKFDDRRRQMILADDELMVTILCGKK